MSATALVLRALYLGDFVTGLPALAQLRAGLPRHRIVLAAPAIYADLALATGFVDELVPAQELGPIVGAPWHPDVAIDLHGNGPASRALLETTRPERVIAYYSGRSVITARSETTAPGNAAPESTTSESTASENTASESTACKSTACENTASENTVQWRADEHEVRRWCRLLSEGLGLPPPPRPSVAGLFPRGRAEPAVRGATIVHPGAKAAGRRWPADRFAELAVELRRAGHRVVITGSRDERELVESVAGAAGVPALTRLSLDELLALIEHARLLISGDTGVAHVAAGYSTASITLFGPVSPARWGPPADPRHQVIWHGPMIRHGPRAARTPAPGGPRAVAPGDSSDNPDGDPHGERLDPLLARITVAEVLAAIP